ncbi:MAG: carbamoyltransferase HypF [Coriobacteriales bacterium]|jgi:hydrogenase maturation protein HypF
MHARKLQTNGIVQGVGFRPFVARLARSLGLAGRVSNAPDGVSIEIEHEDAAVLDAFEKRLRSDAPIAARIVSVKAQEVEPHGYEDFQIAPSEHDGSRQTLVSPDLATCHDCLAELFDPADRRYHYPFINCTNCGPRFTIIEDLPYDRPVTSMGRFEMCPTCAAEYADENDRRYHAQPDACFACGPRLWYVDAANAGACKIDEDGALVPDAEHLDREASDALISRAAFALGAGQILAIKGLGGWHLSCDATNEQAVTALRARKHRPTKPLALMVRDLETARKYVEVGEREAELLESPVRPIVLCLRKEDTPIAKSVAGDLPELGIMLPSTPVQHLLMHELDLPLVMTSGNRSGEPIVARDADALEALGQIADGFLGNNRAIVARYDDSVTRVLADGREQLVRRARGIAPTPLFLPHAHDASTGGAASASKARPCIFAAGPEQKSTFAFLRGGRVYLSQHLGDLERLGAWRAWEEAQARYARLFDLSCDVIACDLHPEYLASKWARKAAAERGVPLIEVQHHHAHIASVLGENDARGPVIGVALDGTGYGTDGRIWGGEVLIATRTGFERFAHLPYFPLPGGAAAIREPLRCAWGLLRAQPDIFERLGLVAPPIESLEERLSGHELMDQMIARKLNCPETSSMGRLFDAVAALLGICEKAGYDGEPACLLEAAARRELDGGALEVSSLQEREPLTALSFHRKAIAVIIDACKRAREDTGLSTVALSGGCMVNRLLAQTLEHGLEQQGLSVLVNRELPPNDGCIAYGQAVVAQARLEEE